MEEILIGPCGMNCNICYSYGLEKLKIIDELHRWTND